MRTQELTISIVGKGDTKERSLGDVFAQVPERIREQVTGTPFRIQPVDVTVTDAVEFRKQEKFLGILFARTRCEFRLTARVVVEVSSLDLDEIDFAVTTESLSVTQHLLQLR